MDLAKGDLVKLDFTGSILSTGTVFDTTDAEKAKQAGIFNQQHKYAPRLVFYQMNDVIKGIEQVIPSLNLNEEKEVVLKPEDAFGKRNQDLIRTIPVKEFEKRGYTPLVGMVVDLNGSNGVIRAVSGGRVVVDFNHPLAGLDVKYNLKVIQVIKEPLDKINALIENLDILGCTASINDKEIVLEFQSASINEDFVTKKIQLIMLLQTHMQEFSRITVRETYVSEGSMDDKSKEKEKNSN